MNFAIFKPSKDDEDLAFLAQASRTISQPMLKPSEHDKDLDLSFSQASIYNCRLSACSAQVLVERLDVITK